MGPAKLHIPRAMKTWIKYFVGTPQRFTWTCVAIALVVVMLNPQILTNAVNALLIAISPLLGPALTILIVFTGIKVILGKK